jgi:hypothetical protein
MPSATVNLNPANTQLTPRTNEIDFGVAKLVRIGRVRINPRVDLFNALNSSDFYSVRTTVFNPIVGAAGVTGPAAPSLAAGTNYTFYNQPAHILDGRIVRIGFNITW